jgi:hypothetical protein
MIALEKVIIVYEMLSIYITENKFNILDLP